MKKLNDRGFSLVELIVVILILSVLVVVLTPQYIRYIEKSRATVCAKNMSEARSGYMIEEVELSGETPEAPSDMMDEVMLAMGVTITESGKSYKGLCPSGGVTSVTFNEEGGVVLTCSKHTENRAPIMGDPGNSFVDAMSGAGIKLDPGRRIDSTSTEGVNAPKVKEALLKAGVSLSDMNIASWAVANAKGESAVGSGAGMLYLWSSYDVTEYKAGDQIPVMCYNSTKGIYTVALTNVAVAKTGNNIIGQSCQDNGFGNDPGNNSANYSSYEDALKDYLERAPNVKK